jgi:hypothetical protein
MNGRLGVTSDRKILDFLDVEAIWQCVEFVENSITAPVK